MGRSRDTVFFFTGRYNNLRHSTMGEVVDFEQPNDEQGNRWFDRFAFPAIERFKPAGYHHIANFVVAKEQRGKRLSRLILDKIVEKYSLDHITAHDNENLFRTVDLSASLYFAKEVQCFLLTVEEACLRVHKDVVGVYHIEVEAVRSVVVRPKHVREDSNIATEGLVGWVPDPFHLFVGNAVILVSIVHAGEEPSVKAHL